MRGGSESRAGQGEKSFGYKSPTWALQLAVVARHVTGGEKGVLM